MKLLSELLNSRKKYLVLSLVFLVVDFISYILMVTLDCIFKLNQTLNDTILFTMEVRFEI
jgi:hypothetical protein